MSPRQRLPKGERKIGTSGRGRVYWKPGEPHPLDALTEELEHLREHLPGQVEELLSTAQHTVLRLQAIMDAATPDSDLTEAFSHADRAAHHLIVERFHNRKHYSHLHTVFMLQRHKRLLGRIQAIQAALDLANSLLAEEETLSREFLATWRTASQEESSGQEQEADTDQPPDEERPTPTKEELRVQGLDEPLTSIVSSAEQSRHLLSAFEARLPELRRLLTTGQGWFEVFYVPKRHYKAEVIAYAKALALSRKRKAPIPQEVIDAIHPEVAKIIQAGGETFPKELRLEVYNITLVGPYAKYRWTENKQNYSISLGLLDDYPPFPFIPEGF